LAFPTSSNPVSLSSLLDSLSFPEDVLKRVLHSLSCGKFKVLKRWGEAEAKAFIESGGRGGGASGGGMGSRKSGVIRSSDFFSVNDQFSSPQRKCRIPMAYLEDGGGGGAGPEDRLVG
jgi:hypothetical protein